MAFFKKEDGFVSLNECLLGQGTSFPCSIEVDGVGLSVQVAEILSGSRWNRQVSSAGAPVPAKPEMYLCPILVDHNPTVQVHNPSFWIEVNTGLSGSTKIWAFRAFPKPGGTGSTIKLSILQVGIVVTGGKPVPVGGTTWVPQTFNACPAGFSPVEAIVFDQGDGRARFLALVMQSTYEKKTLMHCDTLPQNLYSDQLCPRWG